MSEKKKPRKTLSKSAYIRAKQCLKSLYLYKNRYFLRDPISDDQQLRFRRGHNIGELAHQLFPGGINLKPGHPSRHKKAAEETLKAIEEKTPVIYEAVFMTENYVAIMDILVLHGDSYHAWEVKSSLKVSDTYLHDLAFQVFVMSELGIKPEKAGIIHVNPEYVLKGDLEPKDFFIKKDLSQEVSDLQPFVLEFAPIAYDTMFAESSPGIEVGPHCFKPYPCEFYSHCHKKHLNSPVLKLAGMNDEERYAMITDELIDLKNCDFFEIFLKKQCEAIKTKKDIFNEVLIKEISEKNQAKKISFIYVISVQHALPIYENHKPFDRIPLAVAIVSGAAEKFMTFSASKKPLKDFVEFIKRNTNGEKIVFLEEENLLPTGFLLKLETAEIDFDNIFSFFINGIWCSTRFAPDYSAERIRNANMEQKQNFSTRVSLLLARDKGKIDNIDKTIRKFTIGHARSVMKIYNVLKQKG